MENWRTERWYDLYSIVQRQTAELGIGSLYPELHSHKRCMGWSGVSKWFTAAVIYQWRTSPLLVNSMTTDLVKGEGEADGWRREKKPGLVYGAVTWKLERRDNAAHSSFAKPAFLQQKEFVLL